MSVKEMITEEQISRYTELVKEKKKLRKKSSRGMLLLLLVSAIFGGFLGFFGIMLLEEGIGGFRLVPPFKVKESLEFVYLVLAILGLYVLMIFHIIAHEGGHLVFGLLTGYEFLSFRVFSFTIVKKDGKLIRKKIKMPGLAGQCLMVPPEWKEGEKYPYVWYNLGGGIMNLLMSLLAVPLFFVNIPFLAWVAGFSVFIGVVFAVTNMLPMTVGMPNDGKNCLMCKKSVVNQKALYLQLKLNAMLSDGVEITEIPEELLSLGEEEPLNTLTFYIRQLEYFRYLAEEKTEQAEECLAAIEREVGTLPAAFLNSVDLERFDRMLFADSPLEELAAYYSVLQPVFLQVKDISVLRIKYAYHLLLDEEKREAVDWLVYSKKGKLPKKLPKRKSVTAEQIYEEMEKAYAKHPVMGEAKFQMDMATKYKELAEARS